MSSSSFKYRKRSRPNSIVVSAPMAKRSKFTYKAKTPKVAEEKKYVDTTHSGTCSQTIQNSLADPSFNCLFSTAQGDTPSSRDGRNITILSTHIRMSVRNTGLNDAMVRVIVFKDKQCNSTIPNPVEVLKTNTGSINDTLAFRNLDYSSRYIVQHDEVFILVKQTNQSVQQPTKHLSFDKTVNCPVMYHSGNRDLSSITDNAWHVMIISDQADVTYAYQCRARFIG